MAVEPRPPMMWKFPPADTADEHGVVAIGADLKPATLKNAYLAGLFPMPEHRLETIVWWSPDPRGVLPLDGLRVSRSLRRSCRRYEIRIDSAFETVIERCASLPRDGRWINDEFVKAYTRLHRLGWAHSVETWEGDELVGGLYGVAFGGFFAGESMFHTATDASKVALVGLVDQLRAIGASLLDVQWSTPHLESLGVIEIPRSEYLRRLRKAVELDVTWTPVLAPTRTWIPELATFDDTKDHGTDG